MDKQDKPRLPQPRARGRVSTETGTARRHSRRCTTGCLHTGALLYLCAYNFARRPASSIAVSRASMILSIFFWLSTNPSPFMRECTICFEVSPSSSVISTSKKPVTSGVASR